MPLKLEIYVAAVSIAMEFLVVMLQDPDVLLVPVFVAEFPIEAMNVVTVALEPGTYCCVF